MKKLILIFFAILAVNVYAQDTTVVSNCNFRTNEVDEFTGNTKMVLQQEKMVAYTDSSLIKYYKKKSHQYIELDVYCAKINDLYALYTYWRIDSENSYKYFGSISSDSKIILKFTDGSTHEIKYAKYDVGDANYDGKYTTYSSYMVLSAEDLEILKSKEVEKIRMYWTKGYEDYPCMNGSVLVGQLKCLK